ncbi:MAG: hypothetical protein ACLQU2_23185 [Candidatus Binataceae bacterium]
MAEIAYGAANINPGDVPGGFVLIVTFIGFSFGSLTKLHTCEELVIGLGVTYPVFDGYGVVPHAGPRTSIGPPLLPPHPGRVAAINKSLNKNSNFSDFWEDISSAATSSA